jgi:arylsulfatase A-like enzyme
VLEPGQVDAAPGQVAPAPPRVLPSTLRAPSPGALCRRGLAFLLPVLAAATGALGPVAVDLYKLRVREPGLRLGEVLHAGVFALGLESLVGLAIGILGGLFALMLVRDGDLSLRARALWRRGLAVLKSGPSHPEHGATAYAAVFALALLIAAGYKLNLLFSLSFKNRALAALLLAVVNLGLIAVAIAAAAAFRIGALRVLRALARVPVLRGVASVAGALVVMLLALAGAAVYLLTQYRPIVRMIDWRPLSYPGMIVGLGLLVLVGVLAARARRIEEGRHVSPLRRGLLGVWAAIFLGLWSYAFVAFGGETTVRTALLRRAYGAARSYDLLSWALDFDGDGYLSFFGGGDCAPFDRNVHPGAPEIPNNGIDDNCHGGDLRSENMHARPRRFDANLGALQGKRLNLVLITLDGLRADRLGAYGYTRPTTPQLDELARRSVVFERATTQAPSTRYSIPSFLTSKYFSQIPRKGDVEAIPEPILPGALMMAEVLKAAGYRTGAALSYHVFERSWGVDQGFDFYDNSQAAYYNGKGAPAWKPDAQPYVLVDVARRFLASTPADPKQPYFLWVHFFEPHPPYVYRTKPRDFGSDLSGMYDGELAFVDGKVGELLRTIGTRADADRTVILVSADHGREFGEHGAASHGYDLYTQSLHVPLIVQVPGLPPRRIRNPVALLDLLPTMVTLAGIKQPFSFEGESLWPQLSRGVEPSPDRAIFSEVQVGFHDSHVINAITTRDYKLIYDVTFNTYQLFDHRTDPTEKHDLSGRRPAELKRMRDLLARVMERATLPGLEEEIHSNLIAAAPQLRGVTQVNFDDQIEFLGFEVRPERPRAGAVLTVTYYLRGLRPIKDDFKFIVQLRGSRGAFFDAKHIPLRGQYPTTKWVAGKVIRDLQYMRLPPEPQVWEVWVGFGAGHKILRPKRPKLQLVNTAVLVGKFATY